MRHAIVSGFVAILVGVGLPQSASAQIGGRAYQGLFGGGVVGASHALTLSAGLGGGFDSNTLAGVTLSTGTVDPATKTNRTFSHGSTSLGYSFNQSRLTVHATATANGIYYSSLKRAIGGYHASIGANFRLWSGSSVGYTQAYSFSPVYTMPLLSVPGVPGAGVFDPIFDDDALGTLLRDHGSGNGNVSFGQKITERISMHVGYQYSRSHSGIADHDLITHGGNAGLSYALSQGLSIRVGYGYRNNLYGPPGARQRIDTGSVDGGLNFTKALSLTRKTTLSFNTGSVGVVNQGRTNYFITGNVRLGREIGRSWAAGLNYNRSVHFIDAFVQPVPAESVVATLGGYLNQRVSLGTAFGGARGRVGLIRNANNGLYNYFGRAGLMFGVSRYLGASLSYTYFRYHFDQAITLIQTQRRHGDRHRISLNFNTMLPIFVRRGRS